MQGLVSVWGFFASWQRLESLDVFSTGVDFAKLMKM